MTAIGAIEGHALWAATYDSGPNPLRELERRTTAPWIDDLHPQAMVDIGCGTGRWSQYVRERGAIAVGIDLCEPMLRKGSGHRALGDALQLPIRSNCADLAICSFTAGYLESPRRLMTELSRIVRHGGHALVTDVHPDAIASGWTRSFRHDDDVYEIENRAHAVEAFVAAASRNRLALLRSAEPFLGEPERDTYRRAGREHLCESACGVRAIFALLWRRL